MGACGGCHSLENLGRSIAGDFNDIAKTTSSTALHWLSNTLDPSPSDPIPACLPERLPGNGGADRRLHLSLKQGRSAEMIAYESQRVARWYLELSLVLFVSR